MWRAKCGADAIHPGYGFLAEREDFAAQCAEAGINFIGPKPDAIKAMGDKTTARNTVAKAGIPVVPGTEGVANLTDEELIRLAPKVGFPLLVKASAGGGGKGMREVKTPEELPGLLQAARREAESAFGDGNVYLEKLLLNARHVEFQILADNEGKVIYLGERECSCSGATRSCSKKRLRDSSTRMKTCAAGWAKLPAGPRPALATATPAPSSSWSIRTATFTSWR